MGSNATGDSFEEERMKTVTRLYHYVGPAEIKARVNGHPTGTPISSTADLLAWGRRLGQHPEPNDRVAATFVVNAFGELLLAERRSEHVACAGGGPVFSAGEMFLCVESDVVEVVEVSNQSTGFCPEPKSWPVLAAALDRIGVRHPGRFTLQVVFRRCEKCGERNVVRDGWFVCEVCGADLPVEWNF
jgi:hypothetical protein